MSEREVDDRLADWVDGTLSARERERFVAELRVNPQLREDLARYERTVAAVREALRAPIAKVDVADAVIAAIQAGPVAAPVRRRHLGPLLWSGVAAAALLAVATWLNSWSTEPVCNDVAAHVPEPANRDLLAVAPPPEGAREPDAKAAKYRSEETRKAPEEQKAGSLEAEAADGRAKAAKNELADAEKRAGVVAPPVVTTASGASAEGAAAAATSPAPAPAAATPAAPAAPQRAAVAGDDAVRARGREDAPQDLFLGSARKAEQPTATELLPMVAVRAARAPRGERRDTGAPLAESGKGAGDKRYGETNRGLRELAAAERYELFFMRAVGDLAAEPPGNAKKGDAPLTKDREQEKDKFAAAGEAAELSVGGLRLRRLPLPAPDADRKPEGLLRAPDAQLHAPETWLVEGSADEVADFLRRLAEFARKHDCVVSNGELAVAKETKLAAAPESPPQPSGPTGGGSAGAALRRGAVPAPADRRVVVRFE